MSSTLSRLEGLPAAAPAGWRGVVTDYYELTKPRIASLLLITTLAAMVMAARGLPPLALTLLTLLGGALAAASAGAFNCVLDRDIDRLMTRTMSRPIATGRISPVAGVAFATLLGIASFALLFLFVNPLAAWLSLGGNAYYVLIYTLWLKRTTTLNIVIGGAAGAVPPLIFLWTPPHFWALALMAELDYGRARIPMLPNVRGADRTKVEILIYTIVLVAVSLALWPLGIMGLWYFVPAAILGAIFIYDAWKMLHGPTKPLARITFKYSLLYLALMCGAMVLDRVIR
jgi:protoheme IX farnesyltransferase